MTLAVAVASANSPMSIKAELVTFFLKMQIVWAELAALAICADLASMMSILPPELKPAIRLAGEPDKSISTLLLFSNLKVAVSVATENSWMVYSVFNEVPVGGVPLKKTILSPGKMTI